ncbi:MAG: pyridoxamine 5'-phosphate oxidase family protein [Proteiniphilum sp.]|jgi:uncharacterized pyridoxamine 5'-phosphate oxidase family protein|nr:pyridoxamine 5'-phosphate oxidase family protein [Proteiniphilum sp.]
MKKEIILIISLAIAALGSCGNGEKTTDASSGATGLGVTRVDISKEEGQKQVYAFLKESGPYFFSSVEGNRPRLRPIGIVMEHDGKIWFHVGKHKSSYRQIRQNPNIEIVAVNSNGSWIRITGKAVAQDNDVVNAGAFAHSPGLREIYNEKTGYSLGHFYVADGIAEISRNNQVEQILF